MATDFRVVVPADMGATIVLGAKEANKYDVDVSALDLPAGIEELTLDGTTLTARTNKGDKSIDLSPMLPAVVADVFLKDVSRTGNKLVFKVGEANSDANDNTFEIDVADLLPVVTDGATLTGNGTAGSPLRVQVSSTTANNLLKQGANGLYVSPDDIPQPPVQPRDIRLTNASGTTVIGYVHSQEQ